MELGRAATVGYVYAFEFSATDTNTDCIEIDDVGEALIRRAGDKGIITLPPSSEPLPTSYANDEEYRGYHMLLFVAEAIQRIENARYAFAVGERRAQNDGPMKVAAHCIGEAIQLIHWGGVFTLAAHSLPPYRAPHEEPVPCAFPRTRGMILRARAIVQTMEIGYAPNWYCDTEQWARVYRSQPTDSGVHRATVTRNPYGSQWAVCAACGEPWPCPTFVPRASTPRASTPPTSAPARTESADVDV